MKGYIYSIQNQKTGKRYIGATINYMRRFRQHICKSRYTDAWHRDLHANPEDYSFTILEVVTSDSKEKFNQKMLERERHYYEKYKSSGLYNIMKPSISTLRGSSFTSARSTKHSICHYGKPHRSKADKSLLNKIAKQCEL